MLKSLATLSLGFALPLVAQTPTLRSSATLVQVPALVQSHTSNVAYSLTDSDFALTDNGVPQSVHLEAEAKQPLSLVVLIQTGSYANEQFQYYHHLETMLANILGTPEQASLNSQANPNVQSSAIPNQVAIVNFDSKVEAATPFTTDVSEWTDAINYPERGDDGAAILDALAYAFDMLEKQPDTNRHAILLISQQQDAGSKVSLPDIVRTAGETNTTIYSLTFLASLDSMKEPYRELNRPGSGESWIDLSRPLSLLLTNMRKNFDAQIASITGGESIRFHSQNDLDEALGTLNNHIRNRYLITFSPTNPKPGLHTLEVHLLHHPDLTITARSHYWAEKP